MKHQRRRSGMRKVARKSIRTRRSQFGAYDDDFSLLLDFGLPSKAEKRRAAAAARERQAKAQKGTKEIRIRLDPYVPIPGARAGSRAYMQLDQGLSKSYTVDANTTIRSLLGGLYEHIKRQRPAVYGNSNFEVVDEPMLDEPIGVPIDEGGLGFTDPLSNDYAQSVKLNISAALGPGGEEDDAARRARVREEAAQAERAEASRKRRIHELKTKFSDLLRESQDVLDKVRAARTRLEQIRVRMDDGEEVQTEIELMNKTEASIRTQIGSITDISREIDSFDATALSQYDHKDEETLIKLANVQIESSLRRAEGFLRIQERQKAQAAAIEQKRQEELAKARDEQQRRAAEEKARQQAREALKASYRELVQLATEQLACVQNHVDETRPLLDQFKQHLIEIQTLAGSIPGNAAIQKALNTAQGVVTGATKAFRENESNLSLLEKGRNTLQSGLDKMEAGETNLSMDLFTYQRKNIELCPSVMQRMNLVRGSMKGEIETALASARAAARAAGEAAKAEEAARAADAERARLAQELQEAKVAAEEAFDNQFELSRTKMTRMNSRLNEVSGGNTPEDLQKVVDDIRTKLGEATQAHQAAQAATVVQEVVGNRARMERLFREIEAVNETELYATATARQAEKDAARREELARHQAEMERLRDERARAEESKTARRKQMLEKWIHCAYNTVQHARFLSEHTEGYVAANEGDESREDHPVVELQVQYENVQRLYDSVKRAIETNVDVFTEERLEEQCAEMKKVTDRMIAIIMKHNLKPRGGAAAATGGYGAYEEYDESYQPNAYHFAGAFREKIPGWIRMGVTDINLPSEYAFFKNKHEWVNAMKTSEGRRRLFESLSGLTNYLSGVLAELRSKNPLVVIEPVVEGPNAHVVSAETYRKFESLFAWIVLDEIMSTVRFQVSLNFGRERPAEPYKWDFNNVSFTSTRVIFDYLRILVAKVFIVLAVSCALFSYVYEPGASGSAALDRFAKDMESKGQATFHEVTFFRGSQHIPLVTFYNPDLAEQYENLGGMHWVQFAANQGITNIDMEVHKFITPRLTGAFMDFFGGFEGAVWTRDNYAAHAASAAPGGYDDDDEFGFEEY